MKEQLLSTLEKCRDYTLAVAEAMPANGYTFKPEGGGWNFGEQLSHIGYGIDWWKDNFILGTETSWDPPVTGLNKKEVTAGLLKAFNGLEKTLKGLKATDAAVQGFHATLDHVTHHRAQAVVYLRCHGITPPEYTY
ncbi:DinB family protein [Chitinophaga alhagiae]|uniref:DinB family protein n=1 Tax=Chitinophaga alhagiae TaxID=2203219 RepID=UPI000E5B7D82|nr:DinB family protein [Chitinophaga alhagiae]